MTNKEYTQKNNLSKSKEGRLSMEKGHDTKRITEVESTKGIFLEEKPQIQRLQRELDGRRLKVLVTELSIHVNNRILRKRDLPELKEITKEFRKDLHRTKSTISPLIVKKIKDSLKYDPTFSATELSERLSIPLAIVTKVDIDFHLGLSTDTQQIEVNRKIEMYSLITKLRVSLSQMDDRRIKNVADMFGISIEILEQLDRYYELGIILKK